MERWQGCVAVVTGASAGIGAALAYQLQDAGVNVVALARRDHTIPGAVEKARKEAAERGRQSLGTRASTPGQLHCVKCDLQKEEDILNAFQWVKKNVGTVHILINNAGVSGGTNLDETNTPEWRNILETNILGLSICTREALHLMKDTGVDDGHIIHIGSLMGHRCLNVPGRAVYSASKHGVRVLTEALRKELVNAKKHIRITEVSPGLVKTDIGKNRKLSAEYRSLFNMKPEDDVYDVTPHLKAEDVADAVLYAISTPSHVLIREILLGAVGETV